ncbi:lipopolysaccharide kinase InaA family protein, partial [Roseisolibacter sp. H3M3-2]|uniref:lipopolysaccharide kinase InaA family protein n=1 Tax=Roseisolibacter sp. H3M3-2 TaxID=3031323 RepID=UPI0023DBB878
MQGTAERVYHAACGVLGWVLRSARYADVEAVRRHGAPLVRKRRRPHAPPLIALGNALLRALDAGVRVLPRRGWEARERALWARLHGAEIRVDADGTLVLPRLPGETLARLLEDPALDAAVRGRAVGLAVAALAAMHRAGVTHGDAMAANVLVDLDAGTARWFDFETEHDAARAPAWRRADDLRALLATCAVRTPTARRDALVALVLDGYGDAEVARALAGRLAPARRRSLAFHLGQAPMPLAHARALAAAV